MTTLVSVDGTVVAPPEPIVVTVPCAALLMALAIALAALFTPPVDAGIDTTPPDPETVTLPLMFRTHFA
jgi:hypothetical protein